MRWLFRLCTLCVVLLAPLAARAQECNQQIDARLSETRFRKAVAEKLLCEMERQRPGHLEAVVELTDYYFQHSTNPSCDILLANAKAHIEIALQLQDKAVLEADERDSLWNHWRAAWDVLSGISYAWSQSMGAEELSGKSEKGRSKPLSSSKQAALNDAAFNSCVRPARELLGEYPSVTITVEPEDIEGYELRWNGTRRTTSLPRILPAAHHRLDIVPPRGYKTTVTIDGNLKKKDIEGEVTVYPKASYHDPVPIHQIRVKFSPLVVGEPIAASVGGKAQGTDDEVEEDDGEPAFHPGWFWTGVGFTAAGGVGLIVSLSSAATNDDRGNRLFASRCVASMIDCPERDIQDAWDSADAWRYWGGGTSATLMGLGVIGIVTSFFVTPDKYEMPAEEEEFDEEEEDDWESRIYPIVSPGVAGVGVSGTF